MSAALAFAIAAALLLGASDFFAARSARTTPALTVTRTAVAVTTNTAMEARFTSMWNTPRTQGMTTAPMPAVMTTGTIMITDMSMRMTTITDMTTRMTTTVAMSMATSIRTNDCIARDVRN